MTGAEEGTLSFNEVVTLAGKAARGAGLGWGHADDLGRAARWLAEQGVAWELALCRLLDDAEADARACRIVAVADGMIHAPCGAQLSIEAADAIWVVALAAGMLVGRPAVLRLRRSGMTVRLGPDGAVWTDRPMTDLTDLAGTVTLEIVAETQTTSRLDRRTRPRAVVSAALARLSTLADLTLVPASETSRAKGAGGQPSDD